MKALAGIWTRLLLRRIRNSRGTKIRLRSINRLPEHALSALFNVIRHRSSDRQRDFNQVIFSLDEINAMEGAVGVV